MSPTRKFIGYLWNLKELKISLAGMCYIIFSFKYIPPNVVRLIKTCFYKDRLSRHFPGAFPIQKSETAFNFDFE